MPGHVTLRTQTDADRAFDIVEASWNDGEVELYLRHAGSAAAGMEELRLRLDGTAVTEIVGAVVRFATDAEFGVIE